MLEESNEWLGNQNNINDDDDYYDNNNKYNLLHLISNSINLFIYSHEVKGILTAYMTKHQNVNKQIAEQQS